MPYSIAADEPPTAHAALPTVEPPEPPELVEIIWVPCEGTGRAVDAALAVLADAPDVYQRGGRLVRVGPGTAPGSTVVTEFDRHSLGAWLSERVLFSTERTIKSKDGSEYAKPVPSDTPPEWLTLGALARTTLPVRELRSIVPHPFLRSDGSLRTAAGYDAATRALCTYIGPELPEYALPSDPSACLVVARQMATVIEGRLEGYRWDGPTAFGAWLSAFLTALSRPAIVDDCVPGHVFEAPIKGASKTTLAGAVASLITGAAPEMGGLRTMVEFDKYAVAKLRQAPTLVLIDNVEVSIRGDAIARLFTGPIYSARILGRSDEVALPNTATWLFTATNPDVATDMADRFISCRLTGKAGPVYGTFDLTGRARDPNWRAEMLWAGLIILQAYCSAGRPDVLGLRIRPTRAASTRFLAWDMLVRSAIAWVRGVDVAETQARLAEVSCEGEIAPALVEELLALVGLTPFRVGDLLTPARIGRLAPFLSGEVPHQRNVGVLLSGLRDQEQGGWTLSKTKSYGMMKYRLQPVSPEAKIRAQTMDPADEGPEPN